MLCFAGFGQACQAGARAHVHPRGETDVEPADLDAIGVHLASCEDSLRIALRRFGVPDLAPRIVRGAAQLAYIAFVTPGSQCASAAEVRAYSTTLLERDPTFLVSGVEGPRGLLHAMTSHLAGDLFAEFLGRLGPPAPDSRKRLRLAWPAMFPP